VPERHVFGAMMEAELRAGGSAFPMFGWSSGPLGNTYHRVEQPSFRIFEPGDVFTVEIEGRWAGYISQIDATIGIAQPSQELKDGHALAVECFWRAMDACKPGNTLADLVRAGRLTGMNGRAEARLIFHARGAGDDGPMVTEGSPAEGVILQPGVSFVLKPGTTVDGRIDYGRWGDAMVITEHGAERLGTRSTELPVVW
jgi:Xaa-Pro aminopeptidase